jgi:hypothetical protein
MAKPTIPSPNIVLFRLKYFYDFISYSLAIIKIIWPTGLTNIKMIAHNNFKIGFLFHSETVFLRTITETR